MTRIVSLAAVMLIAGCLETTGGFNGAAFTTPEGVAGSITITRDDYKGMNEFVGPEVSEGWARPRWRVRGFNKDGSSVWIYQVYVTATLNDWAFLETTHAGGKRYDTTLISRDVMSCSGYGGGCTVQEVVGVTLTESEMRILAETGFEAKISGRAGYILINVPPHHLKGPLDAVEEWRRGQGGNRI